MWPFDWWSQFKRRMRGLWRLVDSGQSIDLVDLKEMAETRPANKYVNLYILRMARQQLTEVTLLRSEPLPLIAHYTDPELPSFESVVNRLKVMTNLDPVIYHQPKEGRIELTIGASDAVVHVRFEDTAPDRCVRLRLEWLDEPVPPSRLP